jgi:hypothetical protein
MASLESVLEAAGPIELTGASGILGGLTMGHDPATGRRAFRLALAADAESYSNVLKRISDAEIFELSVIGYRHDSCGGGIVCAPKPVPISLPFGPIAGKPGKQRDCPPARHDNGAIARLLAECSCATVDVRSVAIIASVRVNDRRPAPDPDQWAREDFRFCLDCTERRS